MPSPHPGALAVAQGSSRQLIAASAHHGALAPLLASEPTILVSTRRSHPSSLDPEDMHQDTRFREVENLSEHSIKLVETKKHDRYKLVYLLLKLVLIFPVATVSVEGVFSAINHVKNKLRNSISEQYLNDCYIEREFFSTN